VEVIELEGVAADDLGSVGRVGAHEPQPLSRWSPAGVCVGRAGRRRRR
jgi:hypothetical protein